MAPPRHTRAVQPSHAAFPSRTTHATVGARAVDTALPPPADTLDGLFTQTARRRPDGIAVQDARGVLRFATAERRATQLASLLIRNGVQLGDPVIIHCDDHQQALVAQLAVLKAGGVCVPTTHDLGQRELRTAAALSGAQLVLCSRSTHTLWPRGHAVLPLDDEQTWRWATAQRSDRALPLSQAREAAYLLISEGSPDEPTGQLIDHRAWQLSLGARARAAGPAPRQVFVSGPPAGTSALSGMWWAFTSGGALRTLPRPGSPVVRGGPACATVFSPEEYDAVVDALPVRPRLVQLIGRPAPGPLVARHFEALPGTRLRADFAPAGGVLPWASREFTAQGEARLSAEALGTPVPQVRVHVMDPLGRPAAAGHTGELCAAGSALPFDTIRRSERALPSWGNAPLLRSGVLGRRTLDGALEWGEELPRATA
ncbi:AMP-binding protein [Streptomyces sp. NPDC087300]|uniref:AMP-binding protein n=1 Tax=Streptomyces sp. NPDC087300 TaxID=3365780 RepID=UPI0037F9C976